MGDVVKFPEKKDPHGMGDAVCSSCRHEWVAVAPVGTTQLECPACHTLKGRFKYPFAPPEDTLIWECRCGGTQFFLISPNIMFCPNCGESGAIL